jgi:hypothetical protein
MSLMDVNAGTANYGKQVSLSSINRHPGPAVPLRLGAKLRYAGKGEAAN